MDHGRVRVGERKRGSALFEMITPESVGRQKENSCLLGSVENGVFLQKLIEF